ncbi:PD-(D/E)XK nuclease-like domain-containing protein [Methylobacterium sp. ID0610]|uniref:PD-(D/E)XK nuclease-like domain-containing protein n=1 Tax=Methylobacterium carpenticola TaxID=3344827 RepID=UPI0036AFBBD3
MSTHSPASFADGIYFGLDEAPYHADPALGSSDLKRLAAEPADYWFGSALNPNRPAEESTPSQIIGKAVHKLVLEGQQSFAARFVRRPDDLPRLDAKARARLAPNGEDVLPGEEFDRVQQASAAVLANPHLAASFTGGMPEVSIFWTDAVDGEPVRRKARFDYLKPRAVVDLKSTRPSRPTSFRANCLRAMAEYGYPVQAAAYLQARAQLARLAAEGRVHGDHDPAWLARVAAAPAYAFVFVFWSTGDAPLTWGVSLSPGNEVLAKAEKTVELALWNYVAARREHGLDAPWVNHDPLTEIDITDLPAWWAR